MKYSKEEVIQYVREDDVKFIRLAFCDVFGKQKNISKNAYLHKCLDDFFIQKSTQNLFVFQFLKDCDNGNTHI